MLRDHLAVLPTPEAVPAPPPAPPLLEPLPESATEPWTEPLAELSQELSQELAEELSKESGPELPRSEAAVPDEQAQGCLYALSQPPLMLFLCVIGALLGAGAAWDLLFL